MSSKISTKQRLAMAIASVGIGGASLAVAAGFGDAGPAAGAGADTQSQETATSTPAAAETDGHLAGSDAGVRFAAGANWEPVAQRAGEVVDQFGTTVGSVDPSTVTGRVPSQQPGTGSIPRRVIVDLPTYESGRSPSVTPPVVEPGQAPTVEPGWTTTIDLGTPPKATPPSINRGEPGTMHPPGVHAA